MEAVSFLTGGFEFAIGLSGNQSTSFKPGEWGMKKAYAPPTLKEYGGIADCTFATPHGQIKGCKINCHLDKFGEQSALSGGS
jgi:hypothetical protein